MPSFRLTYLLIFIAAVVLMLIALYMQHGMGLEPCALCITQRGFIVVVGLVGLAAWLHNPKGWGHWLYNGLGALAAILGAATAGRQLWLQSLPPDQVPACGPSLEYIMSNFPLTDALALLFQGDGNCAEVAWTFLGISIPGWTLLAFIGFACVFFWQAVRRPL
jgi:disulfide bond formation protein DsbB